ncbi:MAG: hypothetical protein WBM12_12635, partial [Pseudolabrys sp.]
GLPEGAGRSRPIVKTAISERDPGRCETQRACVTNWPNNNQMVFERGIFRPSNLCCLRASPVENHRQAAVRPQRDFLDRPRAVPGCHFNREVTNNHGHLIDASWIANVAPMQIRGPTPN